MSKSLVAVTILDQLGGNRFIAMTGARNFLGGERELQFRIPLALPHGINAVRVRLTSADLYDISFYRTGPGLRLRTIREDEGIYYDQLQEVFTAATGLSTQL